MGFEECELLHGAHLICLLSMHKISHAGPFFSLRLFLSSIHKQAHILYEHILCNSFGMEKIYIMPEKS